MAKVLPLPLLHGLSALSPVKLAKHEPHKELLHLVSLHDLMAGVKVKVGVAVKLLLEQLLALLILVTLIGLELASTKIINQGLEELLEQWVVPNLQPQQKLLV